MYIPRAELFPVLVAKLTVLTYVALLDLPHRNRMVGRFRVEGWI